MINDEYLNELKIKACEHLERIYNGSPFSEGQAYAIKLMFMWIEEINNEKEKLND